MIYPINIKKKIKESRHLKENVRSVASVAAWLKDSIAAMTANQELTISRRLLDSNFGFYVYWTQGFDIDDDSVIHADADKSYGLVAALKCRNDAEWDGEYMDSPYDPKTGDLYCEDYELSPKDNTEMVAEWLLEDYNSMIELINNNPGTVIGGLKESKSIKEAPDADGILYDYEVGAKYNDIANAEMKQNAEYRKKIRELKAEISKLVPEVQKIINILRESGKTYYDLKVPYKGFALRNARAEAQIYTNSKYNSNKVPAGSAYLVINKNNGSDERIACGTAVTENGEIISNWDNGSWTNFSMSDPGYATVKALETFLDYFDAVKEKFYSEFNTVAESKSIKEGLSAKEVLEQAKKLHEELIHQKALKESKSETAQEIIDCYDNNVADHIIELEHEKAFADAEWYEEEWYKLLNVKIDPNYYTLIMDKPVEFKDIELIISYAFNTLVNVPDAMSEGGIVQDNEDTELYIERWVID